jgi:hypothetical protein
MRFGLRSLFVLVTLFALFGGCIGWLRHAYYVQLRDVKAVLAEFPEIDRVWLGTNDDVQLEVELVYFSLKNQPGLILLSQGIDGATKPEFRRRLQEALQERQPVDLPSHVKEYRP